MRRRPSFVATPEEPPLPIPCFGPPISAGAEYIKLTHPTPEPIAPESALLKSIRQALSVTTPILSETPHRTLSSSPDGEEELYWLDKTVIWSVGNVQRRKWVFDSEKKDQVLWVTWANFPSDKFSSSDADVDRLMRELRTNATAPKPAFHTASPTTDEDYISTFGRFSAIRPPTGEEAAYAQQFVSSKKKGSGRVKTTTCICIFLTSFVVIYTKDGGIEYTANLPFHTRRVWELSGFGLLIERVVGQDEYEGDLMPTVFTLTGPYDEVSMLGFAYGIEGGVVSVPGNLSESNSTAKPTKKVLPLVIKKEPPTDMDENPDSKLLLRSFAKTEKVIFSSNQPGPVCGYVVATHDPVQHVVRIWRYAHDVADPNSKTAEPKRRKSDTATPRRPDGLRIPSAQLTELLPATPTQDTIAATLALAQQTAQPDLQKTRSSGGLTHARQTSQTRNELSVTLDRMALGSAGEDLLRRGGEPSIANWLGMVDRSFSAEFWFTCIHEIAVGEIG